MPRMMIENPLAAFGLPADGGSQDIEYYRNTSGATINAGDLVILDTSSPSTTTYPNNVPGKNATTTTTADVTTVLGFAGSEAATYVDGALMPVVVRGVVLNANIATGNAAGVLLASTTTAGRAGAKQATAVVGEIIGIVVGATSASNKGTAWVQKM